MNTHEALRAEVACPPCGGGLYYQIASDAYVCNDCRRKWSVLSVESDHVLYDGGPPKEITQ